MKHKKTSTHYMRDLRQRLRDEGYVPSTVWVLPENVALLKGLEMTLRQPVPAGGLKMEKKMQSETWNIGTLFKALSNLDMVTSGLAAVTVIEGAEQAIQVNMKNLEGLPVFIAVSGEQIIVDTLLVEAKDITDQTAFNLAVLRARDLFPLSSIGLEKLPDGSEVYSIFGALSSASTISNIATEIETLVDNIQRATEVFADYFITEDN